MYKQLASPTTIRVLHVHPAPETDPLICSLEHCDIDSDPEYEAISYVWGDSDLACSVICDSNVIPVTRSLHEALLRIRLPDQHRTVWIDGLCINQIDAIEKSHQVQLMQRVYRNAYRVLVWLGPDLHGDARDAFDICSTLGQRDMNAEELRSLLTNMNLRLHTYPGMWYPVHALCICPWWGRVWIIQEFALAKDLLFLWGAEELQWTHLKLAISNLQKPDVMCEAPHKSGIVEPISRLSAIKDQRCYAASFMGTIHTARKFECSDNRDRIFAILGLGCGDDRWAAVDPAGQSLANATIPDYTLTVEHVYRQFAIRAVQRGLTEDILLAIQHGSQLERWRPGDTPSWSPRWDLTLFNDFPSCHRLHEICKFDGVAGDNGSSLTGSISEGMPVLLSNFDTLSIDTLIILSTTLDKIVALSDFTSFPHFIHPWFFLDSFWEEHVRPAEATNGYKAVMEDLCEAATYHMTSENHVSVFYAARQQLAKISWEAPPIYAKPGEHGILSYVAQSLLKTSDIASAQDPSILNKAKEAYSYLKRFFITRKGYIGVCPAAAQSGDHVALTRNTGCPMILRSQDDFYRIVGSSYVAGLNRKKVEGIPHPLDNTLSGKSKPEMIQIR